MLDLPICQNMLLQVWLNTDLNIAPNGALSDRTWLTSIPLQKHHIINLSWYFLYYITIAFYIPLTALLEIGLKLSCGYDSLISHRAGIKLRFYNRVSRKGMQLIFLAIY